MLFYACGTSVGTTLGEQTVEVYRTHGNSCMYTTVEKTTPLCVATSFECGTIMVCSEEGIFLTCNLITSYCLTLTTMYIDYYEVGQILFS